MDDIKDRIKKLEEKLIIDKKREEIKKLEKEAQAQRFWENHMLAASKMKKLADLQKEVEQVELLKKLAQKGKTKALERKLQKFEQAAYLSMPHAQANAILSIHAGQGGVEAMDWTQMLYRMYTLYIKRKGWKWEEIDKRAGEEAGLKNVTVIVEGKYAYGHLQAEKGVHRLVRQSPFNADKLRQTSFALVEVWPEIADDREVAVNEDEIEWDFFRSSGHGGQNVNKVSTAVRLTHKLTGIVITSQAQRSQYQNRQTALKILRSRLWAIKEQKAREQEEKLKGKYKKPGWGSQIRSYVLHPYKMVKDLRTQVETNSVDKVLDGEIDMFISAYLKKAMHL